MTITVTAAGEEAPQPTAAPEIAATYDLAAEQFVLGAMMLANVAIEDVTDILTAADFYRPIHAAIFNAIVHRYGENEPADIVSISNRLLITGELVRVGGAPYLHTLISGVPTAANGGFYARIVAECAGRRRLNMASATIAQLAASAGINLPDAQDRAAQVIHEAVTDDRATGPTRAGDLISSAFTRIEEAGNLKGLRGLTTGFYDLDKLTGGLQPGRVYVVAGRPGMGKTVLGLDFIRVNAIANGVPCLFVTLEMSKDEVIDRVLSAESGIPYHFIQDGNLNDANWSTLATVGARIDDAPMYISDDSAMNLMNIRSCVRRMIQRYGIKFVVIDYLQLMSSPRKTENRQAEVAELSRGIKLMAKEFMMPFVVISQLNRAADGRTDKRPTLADLRESGSIEQDADAVILLYREDYYDKESPRSGEADFIIAKHRHGPTDTITVAAQLHCMKFSDLSMHAIR